MPRAVVVEQLPRGGKARRKTVRWWAAVEPVQVPSASVGTRILKLGAAVGQAMARG